MRVALLAILIIVGVFSKAVVSYTTERTVAVTVTGAERVCNSTSEGSDCRYLVYTDQTTYENTDSLWRWKWNSSDLHGSLEEDASYELTIIGFRLGFLSWYPNVIRAERAE